MAVLTQGTNASVTLAAGDYVSLKNGKADNARLEFPNGVAHKAYHAGRAVYGPFKAGSHKIAAVVGSVTYLTGSLNTVSPIGRAS